MSKPWFYDPRGEREGSQNDQVPLGPSTSPPCQQEAGFKQDWHRPEPETPREGGYPRSRNAQSRSEPNDSPSPSSKLPQGQSVQTGNPRVWPADVFCLANAVFVKNVTELPTFKNRVISYQKLHISGCRKTSLKSQQIWQHWARVPIQELLFGAEKQLSPPLDTGHGTCASAIFQKARGQKLGLWSLTTKACLYLSSVISSLYDLDKLMLCLICKRVTIP